MYQEERIYQILSLLKEKKTLSNQEIMEMFEISRDTARRDIVKLVEEGVAVRTHGGITLPLMHTEIQAYKDRIPQNLELKRKLAYAAARYVTPDQICFLDASTTIAEICAYVPDSAVIYTNSLDNADLLEQKNCEVHVVGGRLNKRNRFLFGGETVSRIEEIRFDVSFIGAASIHEDGVYVEDQEDAYMKQKVILRSALSCVVADDSKFFKTSSYKASPFHCITALVTNKTPPKEILKRLRSAGTLIDLAEDEES